LAKEEGGSQIFRNPRIIWRYHLERASFFHALHYGYTTGKLGNITTIILLIQLHFTTFTIGLFSASDSERAVYDRFIFFNTFSLGGWGSGFGRIEVISFSDNDGSA